MGRVRLFWNVMGAVGLVALGGMWPLTAGAADTYTVTDLGCLGTGLPLRDSGGQTGIPFLLPLGNRLI